jgi:hypothetical protein
MGVLRTLLALMITPSSVLPRRGEGSNHEWGGSTLHAGYRLNERTFKVP